MIGNGLARMERRHKKVPVTDGDGNVTERGSIVTGTKERRNMALYLSAWRQVIFCYPPAIFKDLL